jgi:hypothetical protein
MVLAQTLELSSEQEIGMGKLISFVPDLLDQKGWDKKTFAAYCMLRKMSQDTARRLAEGETNFNTETLRIAAEVLEVKSIADLIDLSFEEQTGH